MLSDRCPVCLYVCDVGVLWPKGWMDQDETRHGGRPQSRPHCVSWGPNSPGGTAPPHFLPMSVVAKTAERIKTPLGTEVGLGPDNIALDEDPAPPPQKWAHHPHFSAHVYRGQTAGWIKMPLGTEIGLGPGHIVLDGDPSPPKRAHRQFSSHDYNCRQAAGWIKIPHGTKVGIGPGHVVLDGDPTPPPRKGAQPPQFSAHVYCGQTVAHLSYC